MDPVEGREERDEGAEEREGVRTSLLSSHARIWEREEEMRRWRGEDGDLSLLIHLLAIEIISIMKRQEREREKIIFNKISRKLKKIKKNVNFFIEINSFNKLYDKMH